MMGNVVCSCTFMPSGSSVFSVWIQKVSLLSLP